MRNAIDPRLLLVPTLLLAPLIVAIGCASTGAVGLPDQGDGGGGSSSSSSGGSGSGSGSSGSGGGSSSGGSSGSGSSSSGGGDAGPRGGGADSGAEGGVVGCRGLPLCDDFESDTPNMPPSASLWSIVMGCNPMFTPDGPVDGGGIVVGIDGTTAHSGHNSLRVVGGDSCGFYAVHATAFTKLTGGTVYTRFYARFSGAPTQNHNGFLSMTTATAGDAGVDHIRLGFQDQVVAWNHQSSDQTLPDMDPQGTTLSTVTQPNAWSCFEFSIDPSTGDIQFWLDSTPIQGLGFTASQTPTQGVNDAWASGGANPPVTITSLGVGWLGLNDQYTAWFDDIAVSNARIGCQ